MTLLKTKLKTSMPAGRLAVLLCLAAQTAPVVDAAPAKENFPLAPESEARAAGVEPGETLSFEWADSQIFPGTRRKIRVYVPRAYDGRTPACTAVFQDGGGYRFETVFDNLIHAGGMPVTIGVVVPPGDVPGGVDPSGVRHNRTFEYDSPGDRYARFLLNEILPAVEKLRTGDGRPVRLSHSGNDRMIAGGSSGAAAAFNAAWAMPHEFSRVCSAIGSYTGLRGSFIYPTLLHKTEPKPLRLFLQSGTHDMWTSFGDWWSANNAMVRALEFAGYEFEHEFGDGRHSGAHMTALFPRVLRFLWKDWPAPVRAGVNSRNHALGHTVFQDRRWESAGELPREAQQHAASARIRADAAGALHISTANGKHIRLASGGGATVLECGDSSPLSTGQFIGPPETAGGGIRRVFAFSADGTSPVITTNGLASVPTTRVTFQNHVAILSGIVTALAVTPRGDIYAATVSAPTAGAGGQLWLIRATTGAVGASAHARPDTAARRVAGSPVPISALALTGDGNWLAGFEGATTRGQSWRVEPDGGLAYGQSFYVLHKRDEDDGDGALDAASEASKNGCLYVATTLGVQILDANGRSAAILPLPGEVAAVSLCFGGADFKTLYVLGADGKIHSRPVKNPGALPWLPPVPVRVGAG